MRELWLGDRVDFDGEYYKTKGASIYDVPEGGIPIYIAAGGPQVAKYAGRAGDGFICTSGKGEELYKDKLIPAMREGAEAAGKNPDDVDRMIEIKISYDTDSELALENTRFWAPLSLTAEQKTNIHDPLEMEKAADELPIEQVAKRWIVASDPDEAVEKVAEYVGYGSITWSSTPRAMTSCVSSNFSSAIWSPGCASSADTAGFQACLLGHGLHGPLICDLCGFARGRYRQVDDRARHPAPARGTAAKVGVFRPITRRPEGLGPRPQGRGEPGDSFPFQRLRQGARCDELFHRVDEGGEVLVPEGSASSPPIPDS